MNKGIISTASYYVFFSLLTQSLTLVSQLLLMKYFSIRDYGYMGISFEAYIFLQMIVPNALRNFYLQKIRTSGHGNNELLLDKLVKFQIYIGSIIILTFGCIVAFLYRLDAFLSILIIATGILSSIIQPLQAFWLANNRRFLVIAKDLSSAFLFLLSIVVLIYYFSVSIKSIVILQFLIFSVVPCCFYIYYRLKQKGNSQTSLNIEMLNKSDIYGLLIFMMIFLVNTMHNKFGVMFLNKYTTLTEVAIYLAAFKFINPVFFVQSSLISAYMPKFIHEKEIHFDYKLFLTFFIPGIIISSCLYFAFPLVVSILSIEKYLSSYPLIKVGCLFILVVFLYGALSNYISVSGGKNFILLTNLIALGLMLLFCFLNRNSDNLSVFVMHVFVLAECIVGISYYLYLKFKKIKISILYILSFSSCIILSFFI
ncbi:lipopolysaccharide biosynthesis protein [Klebsiella variicola]|uniref:lipopolysaccharide biosynthesis protein n=1 Tax=Klebsiella variicola TaxID=244366 RepID=UPI003DA121B8